MWSPKRHFYHSCYFFLFLFFSLFCCTYNSIDLCCCKSLEISVYWFHFSGELFLTHFFSEQAPFWKKEKKRQNPPFAECLRTLGGGDCSHAVTERWKWFVFHSQQSNGSGGDWTNVHLPVRFNVRPVSESPTPPVSFKLGTWHMILTIVVDFVKSRRTSWPQQDLFFFFFNNNLKTRRPSSSWL